MANSFPTIVHHKWLRVKNITRASGEIGFDMPRAVAIRAPGDWLSANDPGAAARLEAAQRAQKSLLPVLRSFAQDMEDPPMGSTTFDGEVTFNITHRGSGDGGNQSFLQTSTKRRSGSIILVPATSEFEADIPDVIAGMFPAMELGQMSRALRSEVIEQMPKLRRRFKASETVKVHLIVPEVLDLVEKAIRNNEPVQHIAYSTGLKAYVPGEYHGLQKLMYRTRKAYYGSLRYARGSMTTLRQRLRAPGSSLN